jgi:hypothetical protein
MKKLILIALLLTGCEDSYKEVSFPIVPDGLKDCEFYKVSNSDGLYLYVARCPNSQTSVTYRAGKTTHSAVTVE